MHPDRRRRRRDDVGEPDHALLAAALAATSLDPSVFDEVAAVGLPDAPLPGELSRRFGDGARCGGEDRLTQLPDRGAGWLR